MLCVEAWCIQAANWWQWQSIATKQDVVGAMNQLNELMFAVDVYFLYESPEARCSWWAESPKAHVWYECTILLNIFETDCLNLKNTLTTSDYSFSQIGTLISDIKFRLRMNFIEARVPYTPRVCNRAAHELAARGAGEVYGESVTLPFGQQTSLLMLPVGCPASGDYAVS